MSGVLVCEVAQWEDVPHKFNCRASALFQAVAAFLAYIALRLPFCFWLEEVKGFAVELPAFGGLSPAAYISKRPKRLGY